MKGLSVYILLSPALSSIDYKFAVIEMRAMKEMSTALKAITKDLELD